MKQINLLPATIRQHQYTRKMVTLFTAAGLLSFLAVFGIWFSLQGEAQSMASRVTAIQAMQQQEAAQASRASAAGAPSPDLLARVKQLNTLSASEIDWNVALDQVAALIPKDVQLTSYSLAGASALTVTMSGQAPSNLSFANFTQSLSDNAALAQTKVTTYTYTPDKGNVTFTLQTVLPFSKISYPTQ
ncbi:PilN domain-containing protein [Patescibacteria group bacterium]|nr:PilN domain-containing protein [Patescibacteria group bacterium]